MENGLWCSAGGAVECRAEDRGSIPHRGATTGGAVKCHVEDQGFIPRRGATGGAVKWWFEGRNFARLLRYVCVGQTVCPLVSQTIVP